jgi:hypothetical protein
MSIRILQADKWFSLCIRERSDNVCERCGTDYKSRQGLQCCHYETRGNWSTRFEPLNAFSFCYGCHVLLDGSPIRFTEFYIEKLGQSKLDILTELTRDIMRGKDNRRNEKDISEYYHDTYLGMLIKRADGLIGRLNFQGYN